MGQPKRRKIMENFLNFVASVLATFTYFSAVAGAGSASTGGTYQPKTPKSLLK